MPKSSAVVQSFVPGSSRGPRSGRTLALQMARLAKEEAEKQRVIGERVAEARDAKRLTQPVVADRVGVTLRTVQNWEAGDTRISWAHLPKLAEVLDVTEDWILTGNEDEPAADVVELPTGLHAELEQINDKLDRIIMALGIDKPELQKMLSDSDWAQHQDALKGRRGRAQAKSGNRRSG